MRCETDRYIWFQLLTLAGWPVSVNEEERAGLPPQKKVFSATVTS
jgi:hypothetical protein